MRHRSPRPDHP